MRTPIYDFVRNYADSSISRCHMPGHKGRGTLGCEAFDITEISGADVLYSAEGIIAESENNLTGLYGTSHSFYSTEGSTLAIKAMLALVSERAGGERPLILAARNVHAAFVRGAALLDLDVEWIYPAGANHLCACPVSAGEVAAAIDAATRLPSAVYLTSPDYLGNILDISAISRVCRERNIPLLVDNAHGAYLRFLPEDIHPITLGAAMCADSAHKTLPVLTGGAYLHISPDFEEYAGRARAALSLFASTSPSYLTLCSLDLCNRELATDYPEKIASLTEKISEIKAEIKSAGMPVCHSEPLKIVVRLGEPLADHLRGLGIEPEFSDRDYTVLMLTPNNDGSQLERVRSALLGFDTSGCGVAENSPSPTRHERAMTIRDAVLSRSETVSVEHSVGRICAAPTVSCPPAVPIVISGERITPEDVALFKHYGINTVSVVK